jgi:hypothetical protein
LPSVLDYFATFPGRGDPSQFGWRNLKKISCCRPGFHSSQKKTSSIGVLKLKIQK